MNRDVINAVIFFSAILALIVVMGGGTQHQARAITKRMIDIPMSERPCKNSEIACADGDGIHVDARRCERLGKACEWIKWHERCHIALGHIFEDGSIANEDAADACAAKHATREETLSAARWFRRENDSGGRSHSPDWVRANHILAVIAARS